MDEWMNERVCAVIVAYNRRALLAACLAALQTQTRPPDEVLVVDNASTDGTRAMVRGEFPQVVVLALVINLGGAGGFHHGMKWAYQQGFDWTWVMDDDARPAPDCLEKLLAHRRSNAVLVPLQQDSSGRLYGISAWRGRHVEVTMEVIGRQGPVGGDFLFAFVGPLIAREIVARTGLPNKDFFIWFDDIEYALRIKNRAHAEIIVVPDARLFHDHYGIAREVRFLGKRSIRGQQAAWKTYYGARNYLYTLTRSRRKPQEILLFFLLQFRLLLLDVAYESDRWERVRLRLLGMRDGILGRLGKRV